jgi:hypothetical protein
LNQFVIAYINDVFIYTNSSLKDYRKKVNLVLSKMKAAGLIFDIKECEFEQKRIKCFGYIINANEGIIVDSSKVEAI